MKEAHQYEVLGSGKSGVSLPDQIRNMQAMLAAIEGGNPDAGQHAARQLGFIIVYENQKNEA